MLPLAVSFDFLTAWEFWIGVGVLAGIYAIFTLGLQLNVGMTGLINFGQAGFMAIGAYSVAILVIKVGISFWLALPLSILITVFIGVIIGLPSVRLRADYFAIATIAFSEIVRFTATNARELTGGSQGTTPLELDEGRTVTGDWNDVSDWMQDKLGVFGLDEREFFGLPLLIVTWATALVLMLALRWLRTKPWGRVLHAIREDEDAARALGKNTLSYKLQSLAISAALGAIAGWFLALQLTSFNPESFQPLVTFIGYAILVLGGMGSFVGTVLAAAALWTLLEGIRFLDLGLAASKVVAIQFMVVGLILILVMAFRPQGAFGKREEMVLGE